MTEQNVAGTENKTADEQVAAYIECRDLLKALDEAHAARKKPLLDLQERLEGWLQAFMEKSQAEAIKTKHGTAYTSTRYTASLADPQAFMQFVIANQKFDLLDRRANSTAVKDYVQENSALPPGCNLNAIVSVNVRRK